MPLLFFYATSADCSKGACFIPPKVADKPRALKPLASLACPTAFPSLRARFSGALPRAPCHHVRFRVTRPTLRVWLPSRRCLVRRPSKAFFGSPRSWASPLQSFSPSGNPILISQDGSALTLSYETSLDLVPALQRFSLPSTAGPHARSRFLPLTARPLLS
jgi:hypothetical protein